MYCSQCGTKLPPNANFCPSCGTPIHADGRTDDGTTASIDVTATEYPEALEDLPDLAAGTGMFVVVRGPSAGARFLLDREVTTIGRHPEADLFLDDVTVSRNHAEILAGPDHLLLKDLGSLNGTYVAGERVDEHVLRTGDEVQVGRYKLVYVGADAT
jgi:pSer/pThr/pTyr-binding forkhead associated (FHA) protein